MLNVEACGLTGGEEKRLRVSSWSPFSPALSPFVPHGARECRSGGGEKRGEIGEVGLPFHSLTAAGEGNAMVRDEVLDAPLVVAEIVERGGVIQRETERLNGVIEAVQPDGAGDVARRPQHGEGVGRRPKAHVPDDEFALVRAQAVAEPELLDVKRLRLRHRPDDRMKRLAVRPPVNTPPALRQLEETIAGRCHTAF